MGRRIGGRARRINSGSRAISISSCPGAPDGIVDAGLRGPGITRLPWVRSSEHRPPGAPSPSGAPFTADALLRERLPTRSRPPPLLFSVSSHLSISLHLWLIIHLSLYSLFTSLHLFFSFSIRNPYIDRFPLRPFLHIYSFYLFLCFLFFHFSFSL